MSPSLGANCSIEWQPDSPWKMTSIGAGPEAGEASLFLRFRLTTDESRCGQPGQKVGVRAGTSKDDDRVWRISANSFSTSCTRSVGKYSFHRRNAGPRTS